MVNLELPHINKQTHVSRNAEAVITLTPPSQRGSLLQPWVDNLATLGCAGSVCQLERTDGRQGAMLRHLTKE